MGHKLFDVGKVGLTLDAIAHTTEKRKDGEQKVVQLTLRVAPFDAKLATALHPAVRQTLFKLNNPDAHEHLARVNFSLGVPRQFIELYASTDSPKATMGLDHVLITGIYARVEKGMHNMFVLVFKGTLGPVSDKELGFLENWRNTMKFGTFDEADASDLFIDADEDDEDDAEEEGDQPALPVHDFDTTAAGAPVDGAPSAREREKDHARQAKPRHATRNAAAAATQKGRGRR
jgi:hypothetical protein